MKTAFLFFLLLIVTAPLHAQGLQVGVHGGLTTSIYQGRHVPEARYLLGGSGGFWLRLPLRPWPDLQPELVYEQRGSHTSYSGSIAGTFSVINYTRRERTRLHYASLPVLARLHAGKAYVLMGPQVSYLLARRTHVRNTDTQLPPSPTASVSRTYTGEEDNLEGYYRRQIGYCLGLGYEVTPRLAVEGRYTNNWTDVQKAQQLIAPNDLSRNGYRASALAWHMQASYQLSRGQ